MICPDCKGEKVIKGIGCPGFKYVEIKCVRCEQTGLVPDEQARWMEEGKRIKAWREKRSLSLREAASALLILPSFLSDIEHGREEATDHIRKLLDEGE